MIKKDVSHRSMTMLENRAAALLKMPLWVPDWGIEYQAEVDASSAVLMGSYFERIFQLQYWPDRDFDLFCLSPRVKNILVEVFGFSGEMIGCFSRYDLFPRSLQIDEFNLNKESKFFYAGRLSPQKNLEYLILTFFYLQLFYSSELTLKLFGQYDNEYHKDILNCPYGDYSLKIKKLIEGLPWPGSPPEFFHDLNEYEWINCVPENGLFFSTTTLISEDFSVAAAQLQEKGKSLLIPSWGGLSDVCGENVRHFSADLIAHSHEDLKVINEKARILAKKVISGQLEISARKEIETLAPEKKMNRHYIQQKIVENREKYGKEIDFLCSGNLHFFTGSSTGQKIFTECRKRLS